MVSQSQHEIKQLLSQQLALSHVKVISSLLGALTSSLIIPIVYTNTTKDIDRMINLFGFIGGSSLCAYAYVGSGKVREYSGKLIMFNQLEKERFIEEQLIAQEAYLAQLRYQQQWQNYPDQNQSLQLPLPTTTGSVVNDTTNDTQASHPSLQPTTLQASTTILSCPNCGSVNVSPNGSVRGKPRYKCDDCGKTFGVINHATN